MVAILTEGTLAQGNEVGDVFVTRQLQQHGVFRFTQTLQLRENTIIQLVSVKLVMNLYRSAWLLCQAFCPQRVNQMPYKCVYTTNIFSQGHISL